MTMRTISATCAGLGTLALATALATPAVADPALAGSPASARAAATIVVDGDDSPIRADIDQVKIGHRSDRIKVKVLFDDLVRSPLRRSQGVSIFFDTDPSTPTPEYRLGGGLNSGTDYALHSIESWRDQGRRVHNCDYRGRLDWDQDTVTYKVDPACFDDVPQFAVAVKAGEWTKKAGTRIDWLLGARTLTAPIPVQ